MYFILEMKNIVIMKVMITMFFISKIIVYFNIV